MIKNLKIFIYLYILLFSKIILASNSSSFLISQTAFKNYDFTQVLYEYNENQNEEFSILIDFLNLGSRFAKSLSLSVDLINNTEFLCASLFVFLSLLVTNGLNYLEML